MSGAPSGPTLPNGVQSMPDAINGDVKVSPFTPTAFVEAVTAAVLPLINEGNTAGLREGKTGADVHQALVSLFGDYVIEDAVYTHRLLQHAHLHWDTTGGDDARCYAIREARTILLHFICKGISSGPNVYCCTSDVR